MYSSQPTEQPIMFSEF